jgi:hypothetical protein
MPYQEKLQVIPGSEITKLGRKERRKRLYRRYPWTRVYLMVLGKTHSHRQAAKQAGVYDSTPFLLRRRNAYFREACDEELEKASIRLVDEAYRRAVRGYMSHGERKYSDALLIRLLQVRFPEFRQDKNGSSNLTQVNVQVNQPEPDSDEKRFRQLMDYFAMKEKQKLLTEETSSPSPPQAEEPARDDKAPDAQ